MRQKLSIQQLIIWLPSIWVAYFFIDNAIRKVIAPAAEMKAGLSDPFVVLVGVALLLFVVLFVMSRTALWGAFLLAAYMSVVLVMHIKNDKPFMLTAGVIVLILAAVTVRYPKLVSETK
jgi:hypothetical protein